MRSLFPILTQEVTRLPLYVTTIGGLDPQEPVSRPGGFPVYHWLHTVSGSGRLMLEGREYRMETGIGFLARPGVPHRYEELEGPWNTRWFTFTGKIAGTVADVITPQDSGVFRMNNMPAIEQSMVQLLRTSSEWSRPKVYESSAQLYNLIMLLATGLMPYDVRPMPDSGASLQAVLAHMEACHMQTLALEDLADMAGVTPQHLCRMFKRQVGLRPMEYLNRLRIRKAKELMIDAPGMLLQEIAHRTGFSDAGYFTRQFRLQEGVTPGAFRDMYRS